jgi:hypothetical protein
MVVAINPTFDDIQRVCASMNVAVSKLPTNRDPHGGRWEYVISCGQSRAAVWDPAQILQIAYKFAGRPTC